MEWMVGITPRKVLDLGAGAGALSRSLLQGGHRVLAAEPSAAMLAELVDTCPGMPAARCRAEQLPFAAAAFDAVTVASAFHWLDADRALPEIARVLRPHGVLALTWNTRDETTAITRGLGELLRAAQPPELRGDWATDSVTAVERSALFTAPRYAEFPFTQRLTRDGLVELVASRSYVLELDAPARERMLDDVRKLYDASADTTSDGSGTIEVPYRAQCWQAIRH